jgi:hypothetical protein
MIKELHTIRYSFSREEIEQKSKQLADEVGERVRLVEEKKSTVSQYKAKIDQKESVINLLSSHISNGYEIKSVECIVEKDFARKVKNYFYEGVLYDTVPMTQADFQTDLTID